MLPVTDPCWPHGIPEVPSDAVGAVEESCNHMKEGRETGVIYPLCSLPRIGSSCSFKIPSGMERILEDVTT